MGQDVILLQQEVTTTTYKVGLPFPNRKKNKNKRTCNNITPISLLSKLKEGKGEEKGE
jgi:hypothetical protein